MGDPFGDTRAFVEDARGYAALGIDTLMFVPTGDPVEFTRRVGAELAAPLRDL
jgi:hypothetical protein